MPLEYWIIRACARMMTTAHKVVIAGHDALHRLTGIFLNFTLFPSACRVAM